MFFFKKNGIIYILIRVCFAAQFSMIKVSFLIKVLLKNFDTVKNSVGGMLMPTKINLKKLYISINI
jgi:hypothetical protein